MKSVQTVYREEVGTLQEWKGFFWSFCSQWNQYLSREDVTSSYCPHGHVQFFPTVDGCATFRGLLPQEVDADTFQLQPGSNVTQAVGTSVLVGKGTSWNSIKAFT